MPGDTLYNRTDVEVYSKMDMSLSNQHSAIQIHSSCVEKDSTRCKGGAVPHSSTTSRSAKSHASKESSKFYEAKERSGKLRVNINYGIDLTKAGSKEGGLFSLGGESSSSSKADLQNLMVARALASSLLAKELNKDDSSEKAKHTQPGETVASSSCSLADSTSHRRAALDHLVVKSCSSDNISSLIHDAGENDFDERGPAQEGEALDGAEAAKTLAVPKQLVAPMPPPVDAVPGAIPAVVSVTESTGSDGETSCVSFSTVDIRFYERNLSDNPSVSGGPAIGIGWKFMSMKKKITVNEYEYRRSPFRIYNPEELVIPRWERQLILCEAGYTQTEIADCVRGIIRSKNQRKQTFHNLKFQGMEEFMEKTARRVKRALTLGCQSKNHNVVYSFENEILQQQPVRAS